MNFKEKSGFGIYNEIPGVTITERIKRILTGTLTEALSEFQGNHPA